MSAFQIPPPTPGEKAWFEKIDPGMTQDVLNGEFIARQVAAFLEGAK